MSPETIILGGQPIDYTLKRTHRRSIGFTISHDGLTVTAPKRLAKRDIEHGLREKSHWVLSKLDDWAKRPKPRQIKFESGESLSWLGGELVLEMVQRGVRTTVRRSEGILQLSHDPALSGALKERTLKTALARFYKREGLALMAPKVEAYAEQLGRSVSKVSIRDQKRRWGSCAPDGTIRLNWRLMGFPESLIDYVCAHEAAHLVEANHSPAYWAVVSGLMPDWKARRKQMRDQADLWVPF